MACTRFRACAYFSSLAEAGIDAELRPFMDDAFAAAFYSAGHRMHKAAGMARFMLRRLLELTTSMRYDAVFVQREAAIVGPAVFESILAKGFRLPLIFDFDDAIWLHDVSSSRHPLAARLLKYPQKTRDLVRMATEVVVATKYLHDYAAPDAARISILPTVVSREVWTPLPCRNEGRFASDDGVPVIGWVGTHSTAMHLDMIVPPLEALAREGYKFRLRLVGASRDLTVRGVEVENARWQKDSEVRDFQRIDIGVAPVAATEWSRGKGGFKQIQYMTVGVPFVSSPRGGAVDFVEHEVNGLVADDDRSWIDGLRRLLTDRQLRVRLSKAGRSLVTSRLCTEAQGPELARIVERAIRSPHRPRPKDGSAFPVATA